jgi:type VI secretion system protein ImpA
MTVARPASRPLPDLEPLLQPISAEEPSGEWLRFDPVYDEIKKLREEDDPTLPQGVWQRELKRADWPAVADLAAETLATRSKDLQIAAWLTESWIRLHAFAGLAHGVRLMHALCGEFWETLHPAMDEGGTDARLAPVEWLAGDKFLFTVKSVPITAPAGEDAPAFGWIDWEATKRQPAAQANVLVSASMTPGAFFVALARDVAAAAAAVDELKVLLAQLAGDANAPGLGPLRQMLVEIADFVARVRQDRPDAEEVLVMEPVPLPDDALLDGAAGFSPPDGGLKAAAPLAVGPVGSRADAYVRLREASDFLMRTEPHSPVPYLVRRAISWGNMSLAEVLQELMHKNADLATIYTLLGIRETEIRGR